MYSSRFFDWLELLDYFRHFLGRLHRPQDFQFIVDGMTRILNQPLNASTSYIPGNTQSSKCTSEMIMLFWEITQCNKRFRSFIIDTGRSHDFLVLILFYAIEYKLDATKQGVVRMCVFLLQTLSVEPNFGKNLNKKFENQETLPQTIRLQNFNGTYADFLIHVSAFLLGIFSTANTYSQSTISLQQVRESSQRFTLLFWRSSTTLLHTWKTLVAQLRQSYCNFLHQCLRRASS